MKKMYAVTLAGSLLFTIVPLTSEASTLSKPSIFLQVKNTSGFVNGDAENNAKVYLYKGKTKLGTTVADKYGSFSIPIKSQKKGTVLSIYQVKNGKKSPVLKYKITQTNKVVKQTSKRVTPNVKKKINKEMYAWMGKYAKSHKLAVTDYYFAHGAAGYGDWYAVTKQGHIQVQDLNSPGYYGFALHDVAGYVLYQPKSNRFGIEKDGTSKITGFGGYHELYKPNTKVIKYLMADNGRVYEINGTTNNNDYNYIHPSTGFGEYKDNGTVGNFKPGIQFKVTKNSVIQKKYTAVYKKYMK